MRHGLSLLVTLTLIPPGCGSRSLPLAEDGGPTMTDGVTPGDSAPPRVEQGLEPHGCLIAIRVDSCCTQPIVAQAGQVQNDPCLVPWPFSTIPAECEARWPEVCQYLDCIFGAPPSRVVGKLGGGCTFIDECAELSDCVLARDSRHCCSCLEPYPRVLLQKDPCLISAQATPPPACASDCAEVRCDACPPPPGYACVMGDSLSVCAAMYKQ